MVKFRSTMREGEPGECLFHCCWCDTYPTLYRVNKEGFNFAWNDGPIAGQSVPHFHLHVLPRKQGDTGITEYEPRQFLYRPGSREASPEAELAAIAKMIQEHL